MVACINSPPWCQCSLSQIAWQQCNWELILSLVVSYLSVINDSTKITDSPPPNGSINTPVTVLERINFPLYRLAAYLEWACSDWVARLCPLSAEPGWGRRNWASRWTAWVGDEMCSGGKTTTTKKKKEEKSISSKMKASTMSEAEWGTGLKGRRGVKHCRGAEERLQSLFRLQLPVSLFENETLFFNPGPPALRAHPFPRVDHSWRELCGGRRWEKKCISNRSMYVSEHLYDRTFVGWKFWGTSKKPGNIQDRIVLGLLQYWINLKMQFQPRCS